MLDEESNVNVDFKVAVEEIARELSLEKRRKLAKALEVVVTSAGENFQQYRYLTMRLNNWPNAKGSLDALGYMVDFNHGETPDSRTYLATAAEIQRLLKYTTNSLRVAFGVGQGRIERLRPGKHTPLGPCVVHRMLETVDPLTETRKYYRLEDRVNALKKRGGFMRRAKGSSY